MIFINADEYDEYFKQYENLNNNENIEIYNSENNHNNQVTFKITNRLVFNAFELYKPEIYNLDILKEIVTEFYADESEIYDELESEIIELIDEYASNYYFKSDKSYEIFKNNKPIKHDYISYNKAFSDSYSIYDLLNLFDEIADAYKTKFKLYENSENESKFNNASAYELIEYIIFELDSKLFNLLNFKICLNISNSVITHNNIFYINDEFISDEIRNILIENDLNESVLSEIYELNILDAYSCDNINAYEFSEFNLINMYNENYNTNIEYINYLGMIINIKDILKLNEIIADADEYKLVFNIENISDLFENTNNSLDSDAFLCDYYDEINESLYDEYADEYYYELYSVNSSKFRFKKVYSIYDLIEIVLNVFKHYNLNNSFKFNESVYELY